ncbi:hypothetical protein EDD18DRAFT_1350081 [Armillaria luteobubalina]|uniref:Uncharacterized protein n=1 Tax=Armillaria luteobubalina TaxID=153913 RepID=A0AA39QBK5_9AGAR|nr:hypothetical protein EDD18DRAFT_1350081 [Armillaria luteobubalina]
MGRISTPVVGGGVARPRIPTLPSPRKCMEPSDDLNAAPQSRDPITGPSMSEEGRLDDIDETAPVLLVPQSEVESAGKKRCVLSKILRPLSVTQAAVARALKKLAGIGIRRRVDAE